MIREIIKKSPYFIQQPIRIMFNKMPYVVQYGRVFNDTYKFLQQSQNWTKERLQNYQFKKIRELLNFCYDYVPFYQKKWNDYGINVKTIKDFEDFKKLPFTTKQELINNSEEFIPTVFDREKLIRTRSGGTTGSPANFYETQESIDKELAFYTRYWICNGYDFSKDKCAILRGSYEINNDIQIKGRKHFMSAFDLNHNKLKLYIDYINKNKIKFLQAYPSLAYELFKVAYEENSVEELSSIRVVFCASEKMYDFQKKFIENNFNVKCSMSYGHQEHCALFQQIDSTDRYSIIPEYGYAEFIDIEKDENSPLKEIVSTGFNNLATPLIRYKTNDYAEIDKCLKVATKFPYDNFVKDIAGRSGDILITPKGNIIQPNHLEYAIRYIKHFKDCLIIQDGFDHLTVLIVPCEGYTKAEGEEYKQKILWRLNDYMSIDIKLVETIERPKNGKKRYTMNIYNKGEGKSYETGFYHTKLSE